MTDQNLNREEALEKELKLMKLIKALANAIGLILFALLLVTAIQMGGIDRLINLDGRETITFVCILTMFFGMIWALQKGIAGGILIMVAYIVMAINMGSVLPDAVLPVFFFVGVMHLFVGWKEYKISKA